MAVVLDAAERTQVAVRLRAGGCVFAEEEAELLSAEAADRGALGELVERRVAGEPLELVLGWAEFCGLRIGVSPGVFVPRRRTEFLVRQALRVGDLKPGAVVVDLCCGAGAVGAALLDARSGIELHASDIEPAAVACARRNLARPMSQGAAFVYEGDVDSALPEGLLGTVSVLTSNVPYVPSAEIPLLPPEARDYEPRSALDGGGDGLDLLRRVASAAPRWLRPGGHALVEISERQAAAATAAFREAGLEPTLEESEEYETTVLIGRR